MRTVSCLVVTSSSRIVPEAWIAMYSRPGRAIASTMYIVPMHRIPSAGTHAYVLNNNLIKQSHFNPMQGRGTTGFPYYKMVTAHYPSIGNPIS